MKSFNKAKRTIALILACGTALLCSCGGDTPADETIFEIETVEHTEPVTEPETEPETEAATEPETETETEAPAVDDRIINPLTGLEAENDFMARRPVAIMINNIKIATPQEGISYADIMYECVVEGQQTRLMMVVSDYEALPVIGSVRSSREYYLDFAANHNALYVHAGGSTQAYTEIKARGVNNLDGVNMYIPGMFYRDEWRQNNMGYEHSLMTDGQRIVKGIERLKYDTALTENFDSPLDFVPFGTVRVPEGGDAAYLRVTYSGVHKPYFEYNESEGIYYRWQFLGDKHMDNTAKKQLSFDNIIVLYLPTVFTGDAYKHMDVTTTGKGNGYYITMGKYENIIWEKADEDAPVKLYNELGEELLVNRGKTFFQICSEQMADTTEIR